MDFKDQIESQFGLSVDQVLPDVSNIKSLEDFAAYLTLCVDELCDDLISKVDGSNVVINIYARDVLFNAINCLQHLGLNDYARIESRKIQEMFRELKDFKHIKLFHKFCDDDKCIERASHVQRSIQKAYLDMQESLSQSEQLAA